MDLEEKYRLLAENTEDCVWLYDCQNQVFKYISPSVSRLHSLNAEEALKKSLEELLPPKIAAEACRAAAQRSAGASDEEPSPEPVSVFSYSQKYGSASREITVSMKFIPGAQNIPDILGISKDVSEKKLLETRLATINKFKYDIIKKYRESRKKLLVLTDELQKKNAVLSNVAVTDKLTGLHNRYYFDQKLAEELARSDRYRFPLSLVLFDLDNFKKINDLWGHDCGDEALKKVAEAVRGSIRKSDIIARWGGEEFVILMPQTPFLDAVKVAEKLRKKIAEYDYPNVGQVTASFGVAERLKDEPAEDLFKRADYGLYMAKFEGRNRVYRAGNIDARPVAFVRLDWRSDWECGNRVIDEEHKNILALCNSMIDLSLSDFTGGLVKDKLEELLTHIERHFANEEEIIAQAGFYDWENHARIHRELLLESLKLKEQFLLGALKPSAFFSFLIDEIIIGHLLAEDSKYFPVFAKK